MKKLYDEKGVRRVYKGGSLGVDIWVVEIVLRLKETSGYEEFELAVILPFPEHDQKWDERSYKRLEFLIRHSAEHHVIGKKDCRESYVKRNCYMIDYSDYLLAVYDNNHSLQDDPIQSVRYAKEAERDCSNSPGYGRGYNWMKNSNTFTNTYAIVMIYSRYLEYS